MTKNKPPIQWTQKQMQVAELLQKGTLNKDIAKTLGVAPSLVTKVSKVLKKGFLPPEITYEAKQVTNPYQAAIVPMPKENQPPEHESAGDEVPVVSVHPLVEYKQAQASQPQQSLLEIATFMKLAPVSVNVAFTPIMQNARILAAEEWGWQPNMSWEDFFDTCLFLLCRSMGYMLKSYYRVDKEGNLIDDGGKIAKVDSAPGGLGGNGKKKFADYDEDELLLGAEIARYLRKLKKGKEA